MYNIYLPAICFYLTKNIKQNFRWKEEPFDEMDSTLAVQQYIQQTIRKDPKGKRWSLIKKDLRVGQR